MHRPGLLLLVVLAIAAACGSSADGDAAPNAGTDTITATDAFPGVRLVSPDEAEAVRAADDVVVLDVRTAAEFEAGHLPGAILIDFHGEDFVEQLAALDLSERYVLYCRSGNRSAATSGLMDDMGFVDVLEVDGGVLAWESAGLPVVVP